MKCDLNKDKQAYCLKHVNVFQRRILTWYSTNGRNFSWREPFRSDYEKVVAELLLQRTRAEVVATFYPTFLERFNDWHVIANCDVAEIEQHLHPLGLWKRRAASLKSLAMAMVARSGIFPSTRDEIETLPGVGQYIASAILLLCYGQPNPLLDVNMARVLERFFGPRRLADIRYDPDLQTLAHALTNHKRSIEINWAILDFASIVCKRYTPACPGCPLQNKCKYFLSLSVE